MTNRRTLVCGDTHGCLRELKQLLSRAGFRQGSDRLILVGDLVDRGPDSVGVVRFAMESGADCVLGNHEEKHLRYRRHALKAAFSKTYKIPMQMPHPEVHKTLTGPEWAWMGALPLTIWLRPDLVIVHGGFAVDSPPEAPVLNSCRIRFVDQDSGESHGSADGITQPPRTVFWPERYAGGATGRVSVIYGHQPLRAVRHDPHLGPYGTAWTMGIDTSCCYGGVLTGYWVEEGHFVQSKSLQRFWTTGVDSSREGWMSAMLARPSKTVQ